MDQLVVCVNVNLYDGVQQHVCAGRRKKQYRKKYIVRFKQTMSAMSSAKKKDVISEKGGKVQKQFKYVNATTATLDEKAVKN